MAEQMMYTWVDLKGQNKAWLQGVCRDRGISGYSRMNVSELKNAILGPAVRAVTTENAPWLLIECRTCAAPPRYECRSPNGDRVKGGTHSLRLNDDRRRRGLIK